MLRSKGSVYAQLFRMAVLRSADLNLSNCGNQTLWDGVARISDVILFAVRRVRLRGLRAGPAAC